MYGHIGTGISLEDIRRSEYGDAEVSMFILLESSNQFVAGEHRELAMQAKRLQWLTFDQKPSPTSAG